MTWFLPSGRALQRQIRAGEPPRRRRLEPLPFPARIQLSGQPGSRGVQALPLPCDRSHPGHRPKEAL